MVGTCVTSALVLPPALIGLCVRLNTLVRVGEIVALAVIAVVVDVIRAKLWTSSWALCKSA